MKKLVSLLLALALALLSGCGYIVVEDREPRQHPVRRQVLRSEAVIAEELPGAPAPEPTDAPTAKPTATPKVKPTATSTAKPTTTPTAKPTATPTASPMATPTTKPTATPAVKPTATPTVKPAAKPTVAPTVAPTAVPKTEPTPAPTVSPEPAPTPEVAARPTPIPAAPTPRPTPVAAAAVPAPVPTADKRLMRGSTGAEVKAIQNRLRVLGFMTGSADGSYGPITEQAVADLRAYMRSFTLLETRGVGLEEILPESEWTDAVPPEDGEETGAADPAENTQEAEVPESAADDADSQAVPAPEKPGPYGPGEDAEADPEADADALPDENAAPLEVVDGEDPEEEFSQEEGIVDDAVRALLLGGEFKVYRETLRRGSSSPEVTRLQNRLNTLRYLYGGVDGQFGRKTESAVASFQKTNKLPQTGIADEETQLLLFSESAREAPIPANPYLLKVSVSDQRVYAYSYDVATGGYTKLVRTMKCSTGLKATPTPIGTYTSKGPVARWGYFPKWKVYAQYLFRITGGILFHSVLYNTSSESSLIQGSVSKLGSRASHGCVRLSVEDAKWIYNNCPAGTTVTVY